MEAKLPKLMPWQWPFNPMQTLIPSSWLVTYHDTDAQEQIGIWHECPTRSMAESKAHAFAHGKAGASAVAIGINNWANVAS